ncbi:flagellar biosynthesis protein FlhF [Salidesulfovibrio brasiliensis]|uniref:flagellar biosynthesis protein FlhF n=1 Tax=Salidesulfovibrio brasiliensis TaxID=221711 RepID=UPI0006CFA040|nr:flagellar biosynthesis protein FlhF [Salidesulfovibrio brasiliensis]
MKMKTFRAASTPAAFAKVKAELGDDAVILSNRTVDEEGARVCEVVAAVDPDHGQKPKAAEQPTQQAAATRDTFLDTAMNDAVGWQKEWGQIKGHLMALLKPQMRLDSLAPRQRLALEYLEREGVGEEVLLKVFCDLRESPESPILPVMDRMAYTKAFGNGTWRRRIHAFAGPHGSGKTSALIRLALKEKKNRPDARICLVSADSGRGKGRMVLKHYADLSGLAFREMNSREDCRDVMSEASQFDVMLIDLPGMNGKATLSDWMDIMGLSSEEDVAVHLVLNPYYAQPQYEMFLKKYECPKLASVIWTKLDEACTFGAILNVAHATGLPVSALSFGNGLKNSIAPADRDSLWRLIFKRQFPGTGNKQ